MSEVFLQQLARMARSGDSGALISCMLLVAVSTMKENGMSDDMCREALERAMDEVREHEANVRGAS